MVAKFKKMTQDNPQHQDGIKFPCVFPLKVMGLNHVDFPQFVLQVLQQHVVGIDESCMKTRLSKTQKYISVTMTFMAQSRQQIDNIYHQLNASEWTKMSL